MIALAMHTHIGSQQVHYYSLVSNSGRGDCVKENVGSLQLSVKRNSALSSFERRANLMIFIRRLLFSPGGVNNSPDRCYLTSI